MKKKTTICLLALCMVFNAMSATTPTAEAATISTSDVVSVANSLVGKYPYIWGGKSPSDGGFDCTGLIYYVYHTQLGYDMTVGQARSKAKLLAMGTQITDKSSLQPGDIVQYTIPHVGIYVGNNTVVHAGTYYGVSKISINSKALTFSYGIRLHNSGEGLATCATHVKGGFLFCEALHPHNNYYTCAACGEKFTDGSTSFVDYCSECTSAVHPPSYSCISDGIYTLSPKNATEMRLDVSGASQKDSGNVQIYTANGTEAQKWQFTYYEDGYYIITSKASDKALDVAGAASASSTNVQQYSVNRTNAQQWMLEEAGDGYYYLIPRVNTMLCLDVDGGNSANETNVQVYNRNETNAQKWKLDAVSIQTDTGNTQTSTGEKVFGPWSDWSDTCVYSSPTRMVESRTMGVDIPGHTEYRYGNYTIDGNDIWCVNYGRTLFTGEVKENWTEWSASPKKYTGHTAFCAGPNHSHNHISGYNSNGWANWKIYSDDGVFVGWSVPYYYWEETRWVDNTYTIQYRYRDLIQ